MQQKILIPTDFSKIAHKALEQAANLAAHLQAEIYILHVWNADTTNYLKKHALDEDYVQQSLHNLKDFALTCGVNKVHTHIAKGKLVAATTAYCEQQQIDLVVLATHGKTGIQIITGGHAMKMINSLRIPVLVSQKPAETPQLQRILFPIHTATNYDSKIEWTLKMAAAFGAQVLLYMMKTEVPKVEAAMQLVAQNVKQRLHQKGIAYSEHKASKTTAFAQQIDKFAAEQAVDLIVIKVDSDEYEPLFFSSSALDERLVYNKAKIPVLCAQKR